MAGNHGTKPAPPDRRPYRRTSESGHEITYTATDKAGRRWRQTWRQVGWHGQSGAFYALGETDPAAHEPGSYTPMYVLAHVDEIEREPTTVHIHVDSSLVADQLRDEIRELLRGR